MENIKTTQTTHDTGSHTFLTGAILFANLDYSGLAGYAVKAAIGGAIWMGFKLVGDYLSEKLTTRRKRKEKEKEDHSDKTENE